ncbi:hypothetical protein TanjilG_05896 [Lupinus angustifolius]|uniref:RNA methyltransferase n=1 Tax=Lupinus angustifolius TaxID=3871 RepID=A0A4P1RE05_LUPAN|nr:hypothetical protein TanjilG_05896 [Lupinus angustifolius]
MEETAENEIKKCDCIYGNMKDYYTHRNGESEDPRLNALKEEWFKGRNCLDIGCSSGILTINIAEKFNCQSMLGIDIDPDRVKDANLNLRKTVESISAENKTSLEFCKLSFLANVLVQVEETDLNLDKIVESESAENLEQGIDASSNDEEIPTRYLSDIVSFKQEDFLENEYDPLEQHYDTILCLSVTVWIHLNWGDDGIKTLFQKIWNMLLPTAIMNYQNIKIRPNKFVEILLEEIGFSELIHFSSVRNRHILVFQKGAI